MKTKIPAVGAFAVGALMVAMAFGSPAQAHEVTFGFNGFGITGSGLFSVAPNVAPPDPNPNCGTAGNNACRTDPAGAFRVTGISGTFSDPSNGISNAEITGLVPIKPANERDEVFDPKVPSSLSFFDFGSGQEGAVSYNNLFFPDGSPIDCTDFPYAGTFLDSFGVAFKVAGGYTVNLWGDGDLHGPGTTTYGIKVIQGSELVANHFDGVNATAATVPVPGSLALLGVGVLGMLSWRRRSDAAVPARVD